MDFLKERIWQNFLLTSPFELGIQTVTNQDCHSYLIRFRIYLELIKRQGNEISIKVAIFSP